MANPWTAAIEEAVASCPTDVITYDTLELQHPALQDGEGNATPARIVNAVMEMVFGIEAGALFTPGATDTFAPSAFGAAFPAYAEGQVPRCDISIDNVAREFTAALEEAVGYSADLKAIFRQYSSEDLSEPCYGPVEFIISTVKVNATRITGSARVSNLSDKKFPTRVYTRSKFPGLVR
ncbi:MAG: uncharacterized protein K0S00_4678 [Xanthobacteraceae bacterium]|jgi:hypothetical protein|nr:uncharacterized protein [Xanthobacteraceae bacterium]